MGGRLWLYFFANKFARRIHLVANLSVRHTRRIFDMLDKKEVRPGMPGYFPKNQVRYRGCNDFHDEGFRCTRPLGHKGAHAAHVVMGVKDSFEIKKNPVTGDDEAVIKPGMKNTEDVQIATW